MIKTTVVAKKKKRSKKIKKEKTKQTPQEMNLYVKSRHLSALSHNLQQVTKEAYLGAGGIISAVYRGTHFTQPPTDGIDGGIVVKVATDQAGDEGKAHL